MKWFAVTNPVGACSILPCECERNVIMLRKKTYDIAIPLKVR